MFESTRVACYISLDYCLPDVKKAAYVYQVISPDSLARDQEFKETPYSCDRTQQLSKGKSTRSRDGSSGQKVKQNHYVRIEQDDFAEIGVTHIKYPTSMPVVV